VKSQQSLVSAHFLIGVGGNGPTGPWHSCGFLEFFDVQTEPDSSMAMHTSTVLSLQVGAGVGYGVGCGVGIGLWAIQTVNSHDSASR